MGTYASAEVGAADLLVVTARDTGGDGAGEGVQERETETGVLAAENLAAIALEVAGGWVASISWGSDGSSAGADSGDGGKDGGDGNHFCGIDLFEAERLGKVV